MDKKPFSKAYKTLAIAAFILAAVFAVVGALAIAVKDSPEVIEEGVDMAAAAVYLFVFATACAVGGGVFILLGKKQRAEELRLEKEEAERVEREKLEAERLAEEERLKEEAASKEAEERRKCGEKLWESKVAEMAVEKAEDCFNGGKTAFTKGQKSGLSDFTFKGELTSEVKCPLCGKAMKKINTDSFVGYGTKDEVSYIQSVGVETGIVYHTQKVVQPKIEFKGFIAQAAVSCGDCGISAQGVEVPSGMTHYSKTIASEIKSISSLKSECKFKCNFFKFSKEQFKSLKGYICLSSWDTSYGAWTKKHIKDGELVD